MKVASVPPRRIRPVMGSVLAVLASAALAQFPAIVRAQSLTAAAATPATASAPAKATTHAGKKAPAAPQPQPTALDLHAPPLDHIVPRGELQYILAMDSSDSDADAQEISVKGTKYVKPVPVGQFQAIPWALMHPTEAWRVFTPVEQP